LITSPKIKNLLKGLTYKRFSKIPVVRRGGQNPKIENIIQEKLYLFFIFSNQDEGIIIKVELD